MKAQVFIMIFLFPICVSMAQGTDYVGKKEFQAETKRISESLNASKRSVTQIKQLAVTQKTTIDSLKQVILAGQAQIKTGNDTISAATLKIRELQMQINSRRQMAETGFILLAALILLLMVVAFWWVYILSKKTSKRFVKISEDHETFSQTMTKEFILITEKIKDNKDHILILSDDLKQQIRKTDLAIQTDRERLAMVDESVKNLRFESESGFKLQNEKVSVLQESMSKMNLHMTESLKKQEDHMNSEIQKLSKMMAKHDQEKEKLA